MSDEKSLSSRAGWQEEPTVDRPINGPRRGRTKPLLLLLAFLVTLALVFFVGWEFLVDAG